MRLECAMVCDAVTVRDGLLHILGGGIGRVARLGFPAPLDNEVALRLTMTPDEVKAQHKIEIRVLTGTGALASTVTGEFDVDLGRPASRHRRVAEHPGLAAPGRGPGTRPL